MGSLFKTSAPTYTPTQSTAASPVKGTEKNHDEYDGVTADKKTNEESDIRDFVRRSTRGRSATIQTSYRGVLNENEGQVTSLSPQRKSLLGE